VGKLYGCAPFSEHFCTGERNFWRKFRKFIENYIFILANHGVSGCVSIQMPFFKLLIAQISANFVYFTKNALHIKKNRKW